MDADHSSIIFVLNSGATIAAASRFVDRREDDGWVISGPAAFTKHGGRIEFIQNVFIPLKAISFIYSDSINTINDLFEED